jgi:MSHA pilin protein MshC
MGMVDSKALKNQQQSGFTLVELIVTMMIIGILAVAILPRFIETSAFDTRGFNDEVLAALRYGHKAAVASRRNICVSFTNTSVTLSTATASGPVAVCNADLAGPTGKSPFVVTAKSGTSFSSLPAGFRFDALGRTNIATQTFRITGVPTTITVEQETGYVHP